MSKQFFSTPFNSHLVTYNPQKVAVVGGLIEQVSGILLTQYINSDGDIVTSRTVLTGEEMKPICDIKSSDNDLGNEVHFLSSFPNLTIADVSKIIHSTMDGCYVNDSFEDLKKLGCVIPSSKEDIVLTVYGYKDAYSAFSKELGYLKLGKGWIPSSLDLLYSIQSFLKRRIVMETSGENSVNQDTLDVMNGILENHMNHLVYTNGKEAESLAYNDGVKTYYTNGVTVSMTREEFMGKYPGACEVKGKKVI